MSNQIAVIGTGYVGLTTGACFAKLGHHVVCADIDANKISQLKQGVVPIHEDGLQDLVETGVLSGNLEFVVSAANAARDCDFAFMCLPTPQSEDGSADLSYLLDAAAEIAEVLPGGAVVVNKSTVPVGAAKKVVDVIGRSDVEVASNPEFLREGTAVSDFLFPERIVIGADNPVTAQRVAALYADVRAPKLQVSTATAELIKYASNAFLAAKISFANSISNLCEAVGANAHEVLEGMGRDQRIGQQFLKPGPGWGGSCFPKDTYALINIAEQAGYNFDLLKAVIRANEQQIDLMVAKVAQLLDGNVTGSTIAIWGLAFKSGTDDTRQSPALKIAEQLLAMGARIQAYDPGVVKHHGGITKKSDPLSACDGADILLVLTDWPEFAQVPLEEVAQRLRQKRAFDTRNMLDTHKLGSLQFAFQSVGNYLPYSLVDTA